MGRISLQWNGSIVHAKKSSNDLAMIWDHADAAVARVQHSWEEDLRLEGVGLK